ncbi:MAG: ABC transporter substrate-binding protein [Hyphomicrobiaceae bacterium]
MTRHRPTGARPSGSASKRSGRWPPWVWALLAVAVEACPVHAAPPERVVSINVCADQLVQLLARSEDVQALSFLAGDPQMSVLAGQSSAYRLIRGQAEEVLPLDADLVIAGVYSTPATVALLRRLGQRIEILPMTSDLDGIRANVRRVAGWLRREASGRALIADLDARLLAVRPATHGHEPTALVYYVNSLAAGRGTLADAVLRAAGYRNLAAEEGIDGEGYLPLERLVANPPDLIVLGNGLQHYRSITADNLRHPALRRVMQRVPSVVLPQALLMCDTPLVVEAVELLAAARSRIGRSTVSSTLP